MILIILSFFLAYLQACEALLQNTLTQFETNLNKFQLYTIRNIISNEQHQQQRKLQEKAAKLQKLDTHENQENQENHNNKQSIIIMKSDVLLDQQLSDLHHRYRYLQQELHQLQTEHYDIKQLITDMRSAVFSLRVAMQSFEEYDISPLSETTETMQQSYQKLQSYCQQAKGTFILYSIDVVILICDCLHIYRVVKEVRCTRYSGRSSL